MFTCPEEHRTFSRGWWAKSGSTSSDDSSITHTSIQCDLADAVKQIHYLEQLVFPDDGPGSLPLTVSRALAALADGERPFLRRVTTANGRHPGYEWLRWTDTAQRASHVCPPPQATAQTNHPHVPQYDWDDELFETLESIAEETNEDNGETRTSAFFNDAVAHIIKHAKDIPEELPQPRLWSAKYATELSETTNRPYDEPFQRKVDGALWRLGTEPHSAGRSAAVGYFALREREDRSGRDSAFSQLAENARLSFAADPCRRFVLGFSLFNSRLLRLYRFDRSGAMVSEDRDIALYPGYLVLYLLHFAFASDEALGADPTIHSVTDANGKIRRYVHVEGMQFEFIETLFVSQNTRGRATRCSRVKDTVQGRYHVLKDTWTDARRKGAEAAHLLRAKDLDIGGIVHCIAYAEVAIDGQSDSTKTIRQALIDRTRLSLVRSKNNKAGNSDGATKAQLSSSRAQKTIHDLQGVEERIHCRLVLDECGVPIENFASLRELISVLCNAIQVHAAFLRILKILHRDVSMRNIMISEEAKTQSGLRHGMLIDFDYAIALDEPGGTSHRGEKTGMPPFVAVMLLINPRNTPHAEQHDLESFFYVLVWICIMYSGPGGAPRKEPFKFDESCLSGWIDGSDQDRGARKMLRFTLDMWFDQLLGEFHPYFEQLKPFVRRLRDKIFCSDGPRTDFKHEDLTDILLEATEAVTEPSGTLVDCWKPLLPVSGTKRSLTDAQLQSDPMERPTKRAL